MVRPTILECVTLANSEAKLPAITFAQVNEFARFLDSFQAADGPIHVVLPFDEQGTWEGARRRAIVPFEGWLLTQIRGEAVDLRSPDVEALYVSPMRALVKKYFRRLVETQMVDGEVKTIKDNIETEDGFLSQQLMGVHYKIWLPIMEGVC